ncbi:MAG TPA: LysE family translocator [Parvularculaceae bacterium]|nr:LysE family translocator [Parvularculaceae bacterium]HNS86131.1 LysE family translocator [Parvularculaceae bacterium]
MDHSIFFTSFGVGLAVAAPVGPMSLLCMRTSLVRGWRSGLAIGAGIAVGDAIFALIAALGLAGLSAFMLAHEKPLHLAAGLFLLWLGLTALRRKPEEGARAVAPQSVLRDFATSVLLTLTNPPTIIMFAAIFTALAPANGLTPVGAATTTLGVLAGSLVWWIGVVAAMAFFRRAVGARARLWIDRASGAVLAFLGFTEIRRGLQ